VFPGSDGTGPSHPGQFLASAMLGRFRDLYPTNLPWTILKESPSDYPVAKQLPNPGPLYEKRGLVSKLRSAMETRI